MKWTAIFEILGSLGVFLFGMKVMSEALQKVAGERLKGLLHRMTTNRMSGVGTGVLVTSVVQSSSATTVMVVSFVNAGLLNLKQAIGVIMGANIGTTMTGWLVALVGFKVKISAVALPIIGLGMALTFFRGATLKQWGEVLLGFGILFLGLDLLKGSIPALEPEQLSWVRDLGGTGLVPTLGFVLIGTMFTLVLQSSSATMTLTLTMTAAGWISYENALAMILGENVGTTTTALIASIGGTTAARRAAWAHTTFNLFGIVWAISLMNVAFVPLIDAMVPGDPNLQSEARPGIVTAHLAMFHSMFNVVNTLLLLPFVDQLARFVSKLVAEGTGPTPRRFGKYLSPHVIGTPEIEMVQVREEMRHMAELVCEMFRAAMQSLTEQGKETPRLVKAVRDIEERVDGLEREITEALRHIVRESTSGALAREVANMTHNVHRLERIGDQCERLAGLAERLQRSDAPERDTDAISSLKRIQPLVEAALDNARKYFGAEGSLEAARRIDQEIDVVRDQIRREYIEDIQKREHEALPDLWFLDALNHVEEVGDRCYAVAMQLRPPGTRRRDQVALAEGRA